MLAALATFSLACLPSIEHEFAPGERWEYTLRIVDGSGAPRALERLHFDLLSKDLSRRRNRRARSDSDGSVDLSASVQYFPDEPPALLIVGDPLSDKLGAVLELPTGAPGESIDLGSVRLDGWPILADGVLVTDERTAALPSRGLLLGVQVLREAFLLDESESIFVLARSDVAADGRFRLLGPRLPGLDDQYQLVVPTLDDFVLPGRYLPTWQVEREVLDFYPGAFDERFELLGQSFLALGKRAQVPAPPGPAGSPRDPSDDVIGISFGNREDDPNRPIQPKWSVELVGPEGSLATTAFPFHNRQRFDVDFEGPADVLLWCDQLDGPAARIAEVRLERGELTLDDRIVGLRPLELIDHLELDVRLPDGKRVEEGVAILSSQSAGSGADPVVWETPFGSGALWAPLSKTDATTVSAQIWAPGCYRKTVRNLTQSTRVTLERGGEVFLQVPNEMLLERRLVVWAQPPGDEYFEDERVDLLVGVEGGFRGHLSVPGAWQIEWFALDDANDLIGLDAETIVVEPVPELQTFQMEGPGF